MKTTLRLFILLTATFSYAQNVLELNPSNFPITTPCGFTNFNNKLFYIGANTTYGREMWFTDGTQPGNQLLKNIGFQYNVTQVNAFQDQTAEAAYGKSYVFNGKLFFNANNEYAQGNFRVWTSDGTEAGTTSFDPNFTKINSIRYFQEFQGRLYFTAYNNATGTEVWSTDGTLAGTTLLKDINPNSGTSVNYDPSFTVMNNKMYFKADDGVHGLELWATDGTTTGTEMVLDINLGTYNTSSIGTFISGSTFLDEHFKVVGSKFYFRGYQANDPNDGINIYVSDGTAAGTQRISYTNGYGYPANYDGVGLTILNNTMYFIGSKNIPSPIPGGGTANQIGVFATDGTSAGTIFIKPLTTTGAGYVGDNGWSDNETTPNSMRISNDKAYFLYGLQLWVTDGTDAGTTQITNDSNDSFDYQKRLVSQVFDGKLYFVKNAGSTATQGIYSTDGTAAGTSFAGKTNEMQTVASTLNMTALPSELKAYGNSLYFSAGYNNTAASLWRLRNPALANTNFENTTLKLKVYPNPTIDILNISYTETISNVAVFDIIGQELLSVENNTNEIQIDMARYASGTYLIKVSSDNITKTVKVIKK